jgi:hypothetical protein
MTTKINIITSEVQTTFTATPTIQTEDSADNSTKLASIGFVDDQLTPPFFLALNKSSTQNITGTYSLTEQPIISTIDAETPQPINLGDTTDTSITIDYTSLTIKGFLQNLSNYLGVANLKFAPSPQPSNTYYAQAQKIQTGQVPLDTIVNNTVNFLPVFSSPPILLVSVQGDSTSFSPLAEYTNTITTSSANIIYNGVPTVGLKINWVAIGT